MVLPCPGGSFPESYRSPFVIELELTVNEIEQLQAEIEAA